MRKLNPWVRIGIGVAAALVVGKLAAPSPAIRAPDGADSSEADAVNATADAADAAARKLQLTTAILVGISAWAIAPTLITGKPL